MDENGWLFFSLVRICNLESSQVLVLEIHMSQINEKAKYTLLSKIYELD